jgi:hypothetical protein
MEHNPKKIITFPPSEISAYKKQLKAHGFAYNSDIFSKIFIVFKK